MMSEKVNKKGVTLIELVIVMAIIAIMAVLAVPNIGAWLPNYRLRSATRDIASTLRTAQMKAISVNRQFRVAFNTPSAGSYVLQRNSGGWQVDGASQALPAGITISAITFPGSIAEFNTNSTATSGSVTLTNAGGAQRRIVLTAATGRVRIE
jgi:prepilin-type N-terminal cleavage/methylation domain-containing protein